MYDHVAHSRPFHILFRTDADEDTFGGKEVPDAGPPAVSTLIFAMQFLITHIRHI